jgi:DNA-binding winged helix-turn-helix (wHTH) protein
MPSEVISIPEPEEATGSERRLLSSGRYVHFGPFQIDQQRQEVTRSGSRLKLQGKVYQILLILLEKPGEVVTREELRTRLWPAETHVNYDANVNTAVNKLRQALGDSPDNPLYIETIPRKGYCLLVQPEISQRGTTNLQFGLGEPSSDVAGKSFYVVGGLKFSKSDLWVVLIALGLILAGMLLGAGIMRLWINHVSSLPAHSPALIVSRLLEKAVL